jgi:addiction module HigA family antidote
MGIMHSPLHPGEIVRDALFNGTELKTVSDAAERLGIDRTTLSRLLNGHSGISPEMAYKLGRLLDTSTEMWMNIQRDYDLWVIQEKFKNVNDDELPYRILNADVIHRHDVGHHPSHR